MLFSFAAGTYAISTDKERLAALQSLIAKEVPYDANIPIDSIISWTDELAPTLKSPKTEEAYFTLVLWEVNAYIMRGDLSLAIDRARLMYEYAKDIKSNFGIALSNQAVGQAYSASNIQDKALISYMDALRYLPENNPQTYRLLVKISTQLQQMNRLEEAMEYVKKLNPLLEQNPEHPLAIPILIENATYYISSGDQDTALQYLHRADSIYKNHTHEIAHEFPSTITLLPVIAHWLPITTTRKRLMKPWHFITSFWKWYPIINARWSTAGFVRKRSIYINCWGALMKPARFIRNYTVLLIPLHQKAISGRLMP